jgi:hypothetical protein
LIFQQEKPVD